MTIKIDKKIIDYGISKTEPAPEPEPAPSPESALEKMHEEVERPEVLKGHTYKIKTPLSDHALYITINDIVLNAGTDHEQEYPFEVFINSKNMEHFQWVLALTRVLSAVFRKGGDATFLVDEMKQVFDPQGGYFKKGGRFMPSLVAEIGDVLEQHMKRIGLLEHEELSETQKRIMAEKRQAFEASNHVSRDDPDTGFPAGAELCKKCHNKAMIVMDGCLTCLNCGESKCN